jgi:hypothetical protein
VPRLRHVDGEQEQEQERAPEAGGASPRRALAFAYNEASSSKQRPLSPWTAMKEGLLGGTLRVSPRSESKSRLTTSSLTKEMSVLWSSELVLATSARFVPVRERPGGHTDGGRAHERRAGTARVLPGRLNA